MIDFPDYIARRLAQPPQGEGGRHQDMMELSLMLAGEGFDDAVIFATLRARYTDRDKSDKEIRNLIAGAHAKNPSPAGFLRRSSDPRDARVEKKPPRYKPSQAVPSEIPSLDLSTVDFLKLAFKPGEWICITKTAELREGKYLPACKGTFQTLEWWSQTIPEKPGFFDTEAGAWIRINPFLPEKYGGLDKEIASFRHVLVEFDGKPKAEQWQIIQTCGLPIAFVIDSGGKSLHMWVRVDAADAVEYKARQEMVYDYLAGVMDDVSNKNPSRFSRLPQILRDGHRQQLVAVGLGAESWDAWEAAINAAIDNELADFFDSAIVDSNNLKGLIVPPKPPIIGDWFNEGDIGFIFAARGVGKTWFALDMARAVAMGDYFGPWASKGGIRPVLYLDGEVAASDMQKRDLALSIMSGNLLYLNHELLFEKTHLTMDVTDKMTQKAFLTICDRRKIKVLILDNLSCLAPMVDENEGVAWSSELLNWVLDFRRRGISIVFIHHAGRNGQMRGHSRREDPANWIIRLNEVASSGDIPGALFRSDFIKNRNASEKPTGYEWSYKPDGEKTKLALKRTDSRSIFRDLIANGLDRCGDIAEEMNLTKGRISQFAKEAEAEGWLKIKNGKYSIIG